MAALQTNPEFADALKRIRALEQQLGIGQAPAEEQEEGDEDLAALVGRIVTLETTLAALAGSEVETIVDGAGDVRTVLRVGPKENPLLWVTGYKEKP